jgi:hypothetical protein
MASNVAWSVILLGAMWGVRSVWDAIVDEIQCRIECDIRCEIQCNVVSYGMQ